MFRSTLRLAALAACGLGLTPAVAPAAFIVDVLNPATNRTIFDSWLFAINNNGVATGYAGVRSNFTYVPITYQNGQITPLRPLDPSSFYSYNTGRSINDSGQAVGPSGAATFVSGPGGTTTAVPTPAGSSNDFNGTQARINNRGDVLVPGYDENTFATQLLLTRNGVTTALSAFDPLFPVGDPNTGDGYTYLFSNVWLTDSGLFAGVVEQLALLDPNDPNSLVAIPTGYVFDTAAGTYRALAGVQAGDLVRPIDIDQDGTILGFSDRADGTSGDLALWNADGTLRQVLPAGVFRGGYAGYPTAQRNNRGEIVAISASGGLLSHDNGRWIDLTNQVAGLNGARFSTIQDLNDRGQFVGLVNVGGGSYYGYVTSIATPAPPTFLALLAGAAGLGLARRHRG